MAETSNAALNRILHDAPELQLNNDDSTLARMVLGTVVVLHTPWSQAAGGPPPGQVPASWWWKGCRLPGVHQVLPPAFACKPVNTAWTQLAQSMWMLRQHVWQCLAPLQCTMSWTGAGLGNRGVVHRTWRHLAGPPSVSKALERGQERQGVSTVASRDPVVMVVLRQLVDLLQAQGRAGAPDVCLEVSSLQKRKLCIFTSCCRVLQPISMQAVGLAGKHARLRSVSMLATEYIM